MWHCAERFSRDFFEIYRLIHQRITWNTYQIITYYVLRDYSSNKISGSSMLINNGIPLPTGGATLIIALLANRFN
jgi:hypothetical protein